MKSSRLLFIAVFYLAACNNESANNSGSADSISNSSTDSVMAAAAQGIREENVTVSADTVNMQCFVAYDASKQGVRPIVLVLPEWWGLNDYPRSRVKQLAALGYFAMAVDLFGNGKVGQNPDEAKALTGPLYANPQTATSRIQAALTKAKSYPQADSSKTAAIGYCFGGSMVLNAARLGTPFTAVVSFHGGLAGVTPKRNTITSKILVCHGEADQFVPADEVRKFKKQMDSVGAQFTFKTYANATHAFTNPESDANAKKFKMPIAYNAAADKQSWKDMKDFFDAAFK